MGVGINKFHLKKPLIKEIKIYKLINITTAPENGISKKIDIKAPPKIPIIFKKQITIIKNLKLFINCKTKVVENTNKTETNKIPINFTPIIICKVIKIKNEKLANLKLSPGSSLSVICAIHKG